jgi:hypothetical protein
MEPGRAKGDLRVLVPAHLYLELLLTQDARYRYQLQPQI